MSFFPPPEPPRLAEPERDPTRPVWWGRTGRCPGWASPEGFVLARHDTLAVPVNRLGGLPERFQHRAQRSRAARGGHCPPLRRTSRRRRPTGRGW
jgi:hypothetical protein